METITIPVSYIRKVDEVLSLQQKYFEKIKEAKKSNLGSLYQEAKDILRECKALEEELRVETKGILKSIYGSMTADEALKAMREQLDEDHELARKEAKRG